MKVFRPPSLAGSALNIRGYENFSRLSIDFQQHIGYRVLHLHSTTPLMTKEKLTRSETATFLHKLRGLQRCNSRGEDVQNESEEQSDNGC